MKEFFESLGLSILAVFAPIRPLMLVTGVLVLTDMFTGIMAARKAGTPITSSGLKQSVKKLLMYEIALCLAYLVHTYMIGDLLPAEKIIAAMVAATELKSVLENMDIMNGAPVFATVIQKLASQSTPKVLPTAPQPPQEPPKDAS